MSKDHTTSGDNAKTTASATLLEQALAQNEGVKDSLVAVADDLLLVSTVLKQELPDNAQSADVAQALEKHDELETQVQECASELESVNQALASEIGEREKLERALAASQQRWPNSRPTRNRPARVSCTGLTVRRALPTLVLPLPRSLAPGVVTLATSAMLQPEHQETHPCPHSAPSRSRTTRSSHALPACC